MIISWCPHEFSRLCQSCQKVWGKSRPSTATDYYCSFSIWYHQKERDLIVVGRKTNFRLLWLEWLPFFAFIIKQTENLKFKVSRPKMRSPLCTLRQNCTFCTKLILFNSFNFWCKKLKFRQKKKKSTFLYFLYFYPSVTSKGIKWKQHWQNKKLLSCVAVNCDFSSSVKRGHIGRGGDKKNQSGKSTATLKQPKRLFLKRWFSERRKRKGVPSILLP